MNNKQMSKEIGNSRMGKTREFCRQRSLAGYSLWVHKELDMIK